jgi:hypothetical protein
MFLLVYLPSLFHFCDSQRYNIFFEREKVTTIRDMESSSRHALAVDVAVGPAVDVAVT